MEFAFYEFFEQFKPYKEFSGAGENYSGSAFSRYWLSLTKKTGQHKGASKDIMREDMADQGIIDITGGESYV